MIKFRPARELPQNPEDGMRIVAVLRQLQQTAMTIEAIDWSPIEGIWYFRDGSVMRSTEIIAWIPESELIAAAMEEENAD